MLTGIRKHTRGAAALIIVGLIGLAFVAADIRDVFNPGAGDRLVNGEGVSVNDAEFRRVFDNTLAMIRSRKGNEGVTQRDLVDRQIDREVLQRIVFDKALAANARRVGLYVSDQTILERVRREFGDPVTGEFSKNSYTEGLRVRGLTATTYEASLREDLLRAQFERTLVAGARAPASLGRAQALLMAEKRFVSAARAPISRIPTPADPSEAELTAWYATPPAEFTRPEQRDLTLFIADPADFIAKVTLTEEEVAKQADFVQSREGGAERRSYTQVSFATADRAKAETAVTRLRAGAKPDAVAKELGGQVLSQQDAARAAIGDARVADAVFAASAPGVLDVVQTGFGVAAIKLEVITPAATAPRAEILQRVRGELARTRALAEAQKAVDAFEQLKLEGGEPANAAAGAGLRLVKLAAIDARGNDDSGKPVPEAQNIAEKLRDAFALADGEATGFTSTADGRWISAQVDAIRASGVRPLGEVRARAVEAYKRQKLVEGLQALADSVIKDVASGKSFAEAVRAKGLSLDLNSREMTRATMPSREFAQVFSGKARDTFAVGQAPQILLIHIERIERPDIAANPDAIERNRMQFNALMPSLMFQAGAQTALGHAKPKINENRLNQLVGRKAGEGAAR